MLVFEVFSAKILVMKNNKLYLKLFLGILGLIFVGFMAVKVIPNIFVTWTKAAPSTKVSLSNSYLIGGNILAKADGLDMCVVNVFVLDSNGKGVSGVNVVLDGFDGGELQAVSDVSGKALFEVASKKEGQFVLRAIIGGVPLDKTLKVTFRN